MCNLGLLIRQFVWDPLLFPAEDRGLDSIQVGRILHIHMDYDALAKISSAFQWSV